MKANTLVREANIFADEMGKNTTFGVTLQIPPQNLSPNRKRSSFVSEPAILVKRKGKPNQVSYFVRSLPSHSFADFIIWQLLLKRLFRKNKSYRSQHHRCSCCNFCITLLYRYWDGCTASLTVNAIFIWTTTIINTKILIIVNHVITGLIRLSQSVNAICL